MDLPRHGRRIGCALLAALGWSAAAQSTPGNRPAGALRQVRFYAVVSGKSFDNMNRDDVRAALKGWFDMVGRRRGFLLDSRVDIADSVAEIRSRLENRSVDLMALTTPEYLELERSRLVLPGMAYCRDSGPSSLYSYVLVANPSAGDTVRSLRGKTLMTASWGASKVENAWIEVLLNSLQLGRAASFFGATKTAATPQSCILPVFSAARTHVWWTKSICNWPAN